MNEFKGLIEQLGISSVTSQWLVVIVLIVFMFIIGKVISLILKHFSQKRLITEKPVYASFISAISKSVVFLLISFGIFFGFKVIEISNVDVNVLSIISRILITLSIGFFVFYLVEVPAIWFETLVEKSDTGMNKMFLPVIKKSLRIIVIIFILFQVIQTLSEKPLASVLAGLGIGGLAVALAAQDTLKHFIGSFVIAGDKPFEIGERVVIDGHDGAIENIGLRSTRIRTLEGHLVSIPNGELANRTIQNIGQRPYIRRLANITITYDTPPEKIEEAVNILKSLLENHEGMHEDFPPRVYFNNLNADSLNIIMLFWYHPPEYWKYMEFNEKLNFEIINRFNAAGIDFAFPTQTLHVAGDAKRPFKVNMESTNDDAFK